MSVPKTLLQAGGVWRGVSRLNLAWPPGEERVLECASELHVELSPGDAFATLDYRWTYEGEPQSGAILVSGAEDGPVEFAWTDSWHLSAAVMHLTGVPAPDGSVKARGSYAAGDEVCDWTIALHADEGRLSLKMEYIAPAGDAEWAVEALYTRG